MFHTINSNLENKKFLNWNTKFAQKKANNNILPAWYIVWFESYRKHITHFSYWNQQQPTKIKIKIKKALKNLKKNIYTKRVLVF